MRNGTFSSKFMRLISENTFVVLACLAAVGFRCHPIQPFSQHCQRKAEHARAIWTLLVLGEWLDWAATETDCGQATEATTIFSMIPDANLLERPFSIHL